MHWITLVLFIVGEAVAKVKFFSACPSIKPVPNFDVTKLSGIWYEAKRYNNIFEIAGKCVTTNFTVAEDGSVEIRNTQISSVTGITSAIDGIARQIGGSGSNEFAVSYPSLRIDPKAPYWFLGTDFVDWVSAWSCKVSGIVSYRYGWILTRKQHPPDSVLGEAYGVFENNKISTTEFHSTDQETCPETDR